MKTFTGVEKLPADFVGKIPWPTSPITLCVLKSFFKFAQAIAISKVGFEGDPSENWLLNAYYATRRNKKRNLGEDWCGIIGYSNFLRRQIPNLL
jgi:hypothetical protein